MNRHLEALKEFLRFESISADSQYQEKVNNGALWLTQYLKKIGLTTETVQTSGNPLVIARNAHQEGRRTILIYGHYDVQPVDPIELWDTPPFEPTIKEGKIFCRGCADNKGQMFVYIAAIHDLLEADEEPNLNLIFLFEGEEEVGSPSLAPFLEKHKEDFACDIIAISDTGMVAAQTPTMDYGLRGVACLEFELTGSQTDLHSGLYGGAVKNPGSALSQLITSLHDENGKVAIEGFYADVLAVEPWEQEMWSKEPTLSDETFRKNAGVPVLFGEANHSAAERIWVRPTAEVNGMGYGYQGEGSKTVIGSKAFAKLSFRLVPNQDPEKILKLAVQHLENHCPKGVTIKIELEHSGKPYLMNPNSSFGISAQNALEKSFGKKPVLVRGGGSIPIVQDMKEILGADSLMIGLCLPDAKIHAPNENYPLENFDRGILMAKALFKELEQQL